MAAIAKRPALPVILLANDLRDGDVVFATAAGDAFVWTRDPALALVADNDATADRLDAFAVTEFKAQRVVDAYLVDVATETGRPVPRHYRERMKTLGPSNRPDLGKQAGEGIGPAGQRA